MDAETAKQIFSAGEHLEKQDKIKEAIACFQQATKLNPEHHFYHYKLGTILRKQERLSDAIQAFRQAIALHSEDSWSHHALGEISAKQQDFSTAITYYRQAIELNPDFSWSHYNLGRIFQQQNQLKEAQKCYQIAIELDAEFFWSHYFLAEVLREKKEIETAIYHYQVTVKLNPNCHEAYYQLGRQAQNKKDLEQAATYYQQAINLEQNNYSYYYYFGETLIQLKRFEEAIHCCEKAIAIQPNNIQSFFYLGTALINRGENALADYRNFVREQSQLFQINFELGLAQAWQQLEEFSHSIRCCQNAIKISPTAELPFRILQYIPTDEPDDLEQTINFYQQIAQSSQTCPLLWGNLGDLLTKQSRIEEAIECYRTSCYENAIVKNPKLAELNWQEQAPKSPDFMIIGATKCGTTSLFSYLNQHSQILTPHRKEINFFNHNFSLGLPWYLAHFPTIANIPEYITGEASPFYIYNEEVIHRIKEFLPEVKIIAMLRNPVERTISEYYHAANHGLEKRSLAEIIGLEKKRLEILPRSKAMENFGYLLNSIYIEKLAKWMKHFPEKNILIIKSESLFEEPISTTQQVCKFLGISNENIDHLIRYNVGTYPPVTEDIKQQLQEFFIPFNQELEEYLDLKFDWK